MYKTDFYVKYHDIERELIMNLQRRAQEKQARETAALIAAATEAIAQREKQMQALLEKRSIKEEPKKRGRKKKVVEPIVEKKVEESTEEKEKAPIIEVKEVKDEEDEEEDIEYTIDDVHTICNKLYHDELLSVFGVDTINDENMDKGIKMVIEKMIENDNFRQLLEEIKRALIDITTLTNTSSDLDNIRKNLEYVIFITLFSQHVFYVTHKCICQLYTVGQLSPELYVQLRDKTISIFRQ
jgi:hypothetical protein